MPSTELYQHRQERRAKRSFDRGWKKTEFDFAPRAACQRCNGGWMEEIDRSGQELVEPCVLGAPKTFSSRAEHSTLARWATLVGVLLDQTSPDPAIPSDWHHELCKQRKPFDRSVVWLAATDVPSAGYELNAWPRPVALGGAPGTRNAYFCTFRIQHLVVQMFIPLHGAPAQYTPDGLHVPKYVRRVWPSPLMPVSWPPEGTIDPSRLEEFADGFITDWSDEAKPD